MLITADLHTLDVSDLGPIAEPYVTRDGGVCRLWFTPTPGVMAWFRQQLARAAVANKLSDADKAELRRMRSAYVELCKSCPPQGDPVVPDDGETWAKIDDFVAGDGKFIAVGDGSAWRPFGDFHRVYTPELGFIDEIE